MNDRQKTKGHKGQVSTRRISSKTVNIWGIYSSLEEAFEFCLSSLADEHNTLPKSTRRHVKLDKFIIWNPHDYRIYYINIDLRHQYMEFLPLSSQTFLRAKRSQERRARRNGCFRRLGVFIINNSWGDLWVLQSSGNFTVLLLRSIISLKLPSCAVVLSWFCPHPSLPLDVSW